MSNAALNWAFEQRTVADPLAQLLLIALANRLNGKTGRLNPLDPRDPRADTSMSKRAVEAQDGHPRQRWPRRVRTARQIA